MSVYAKSISLRELFILIWVDILRRFHNVGFLARPLICYMFKPRHVKLDIRHFVINPFPHTINLQQAALKTITNNY